MTNDIPLIEETPIFAEMTKRPPAGPAEYLEWIDGPSFFTALLTEGWDNILDNMVHECNDPSAFEELETEAGMKAYDEAYVIAKKTLIHWMEANL